MLQHLSSAASSARQYSFGSILNLVKSGKKIYNLMKIAKRISTITLILLLIFIGLFVVSNYKYIFPFMTSSDYCIETITDESDGFTIFVYHNKNCPMYKSHWFNEKGNKYNIFIRQKSSFCTSCFDKDEVIKLISISNANLSHFCKNLKINGASDDYIIKRINIYNKKPTISEIYF